MTDQSPIKMAVERTARERRNAQASQILDALDKLHEPGHTGAFGTDAHGFCWVRHEVHGTFRGSSMRDAMAQLLTAKEEM